MSQFTTQMFVQGLYLFIWRARKIAKAWALSGKEEENGSLSMIKILFSHFQVSVRKTCGVHIAHMVEFTFGMYH
jgi:hypothetical protein